MSASSRARWLSVKDNAPGEELRKDTAIQAFINRHLMCSQGPMHEQAAWFIYKHPVPSKDQGHE